MIAFVQRLDDSFSERDAAFSDEVSIADKERLLCPGKLHQFGTEFLTASTGSTGGTSAAGRVHCASDAEGREKGGPRGHSSSLAGPRHNRPASAGRACAVPYCGRGTSSHLPLHSEHIREAEGDTAGSLLPDFSPDHLRQICL